MSALKVVHILAYRVIGGSTPILTIGDPEIVKDVLVRDFHAFTDKPVSRDIHPIIGKKLNFLNGSDWKRVRSITSPTFSTGKMKKMFPTVEDVCNELLAYMDDHVNNGGSVELGKAYGNLAMEVIAKCVFATTPGCFKTTDGDDHMFIKQVREIFNPTFYRFLLSVSLPKWLRLRFKVYSYIKNSCNDYLIALIRQIIKQRKETQTDGKPPPTDFIQLLINADKEAQSAQDIEVRDVDDSNEVHFVNEGQEELESNRNLFSTVSNKTMSEAELIGAAWVFLAGGYETSASTLTYITYELALNQDIQQRLYEEVIGAQDENGNIDYDTVTRLPYIDACLSEGLRLHTPVIRIPREATQEYTLKKYNLTIPKGQVIEVPVYAIHHSEEFWPNPFKFDPDRFMPENRNKIVPYSYLPFAAGPRYCMGRRFALMETKLVLAQVIKRFRFFRVERTDIPIRKKNGFVINSPYDIIVGIERRSA